MTTTTAANASPRARRLGLFRDAFASEWIKLTSLHSTLWALLVTVVTAVGGSAIVAHTATGDAHAPFSPVEGLYIAWLEYPVLAVGILGVLIFTSEYATGQIRTTLIGLPQRGVLLAAKVGVLGVLMLALGEVLSFASLFTARLTSSQPSVLSLAEPGVARSVIAAGFDLFAVALLGVGLGALLRNTAGAIAALPAILYLPLALLSLPAPWGSALGRFVMLVAAFQSVSPDSHPGLLPPSTSLLIVAAWPAMALVAAWIFLSRRDV